MSSPKSPARLGKTLSPIQQTVFNYDILDECVSIVVQQRTLEIKGLLRRTAQDIIDIGLKLSDVKQELGHGHFLAWLRTEFDWSESTARKFIQVGRKFKMVNFTALNVAPSALYLLSNDSTPEEAREEALQRASCGEVITRAKAKAITQQCKSLYPSNDTVVVNVDDKNLSSLGISDEVGTPNSSDYYQSLSAQLHLLNEAQIAALWQALSQRLSTKHLTLHNWSKEKLERLVAQAQQVLSGQ